MGQLSRDTDTLTRTHHTQPHPLMGKTKGFSYKQAPTWCRGGARGSEKLKKGRAKFVKLFL